MNLTNPNALITVGNRSNGSLNIDNTTAGTAMLTTTGTLMVGTLLTTSGTTYNTRVQEGTTGIIGSSPTVTVGTLNFGPGTPLASTRLYSLFSGTFNAGDVDLTSYLSTSAGSHFSTRWRHDQHRIDELRRGPLSKSGCIRRESCLALRQNSRHRIQY